MASGDGICVVTDSTADIPQELVEELGITVVPLSVTIAGETFVDGSITMAEFFRRMNARRELPTTSQPSVGAFVEAFEAGLSRCKEVVSHQHLEPALGNDRVGTARPPARSASGCTSSTA